MEQQSDAAIRREQFRRDVQEAGLLVDPKETGKAIGRVVWEEAEAMKKVGVCI